MKIFLVYDIADEALLDDKIIKVHSNLIAANLDSYKSSNTTSYTEKRYHPDGNLVCASLDINKYEAWKEYILREIDETELVKLSEDWHRED